MRKREGSSPSPCTIKKEDIMNLKEHCKTVAELYEEKHGTDALLKLSFSIISQLLVEKGIFSEKELRDKFRSEVFKGDKSHCE